MSVEWASGFVQFFLRNYDHGFEYRVPSPSNGIRTSVMSVRLVNVFVGVFSWACSSLKFLKSSIDIIVTHPLNTAIKVGLDLSVLCWFIFVRRNQPIILIALNALICREHAGEHFGA
jgi:hypothetical protein